MTLLAPPLLVPRSAPREDSGATGAAAPTPPAAETRETIERSGMDDDSLAGLYQSHAPAIYAHCRRLLGSPALARDATHEAFARTLAQGRAGLTADQALRYLFRVSTNICLNLLREQRVHRRAGPALAHRSVSPSPEGRHVARAFALALLERCDDLGASIAVLHFVDGLSQVEIASTLGITRRTVFNRLRKLARLAHELLGPGAGSNRAPTDRDPPEGES
jgi:RNA polymerase sigma-70 factor (ECF subfamily)